MRMGTIYHCEMVANVSEEYYREGLMVSANFHFPGPIKTRFDADTIEEAIDCMKERWGHLSNSTDDWQWETDDDGLFSRVWFANSEDLSPIVFELWSE